MSEFLRRKCVEYQAKLDAQAAEKRRQWQEIKQNAPDLADFMLGLDAKFSGKRGDGSKEPGFVLLVYEIFN